MDRNRKLKNMKNRTFFTFLLLVSTLLSCKKVENRLNDLLPSSNPKGISIKEMIKDFKGDQSISEIKGIQVEDIFYKEYFVYTGNKKRIIEGINKIDSKELYSIDCKLITKNDFDKSIIKSERNIHTSFFWKFERLKKYAIYSCTKGLNKHFVIFDDASDTVYHRVEEIKE